MRACASMMAVACALGCEAPRQAGRAPNEGGVPDSHLELRCSTLDDCDDNDLCTLDRCGTDGHCYNEPRDCSYQDGACTRGACQPESGECLALPAGEGATCIAPPDLAGHCAAGTCVPDPSCDVYLSIGCYAFNHSRSDSLVGASVIDGYPCAAGEDGPERAYSLGVTTDRRITLALSGTTTDLDLIVLDGGACVGTAACVAQATQAGVGDEQLTFDAKANHDYVVVVESHAGAGGSFTLTASCAGCAVESALACNQTIVGDTTSGPDGLGGYQCAPLEHGPERAYTIAPPVETNYRLTLTGLANNLDLVVLADGGGTCDPSACRAQGTLPGSADETVAFTALANTTYYAVVDGETPGPYQLEVSCPPSCRSTVNTLSCGTPSDSRRNDDPVRSKSLVDNWSCAPRETGPEVVYSFYAGAAGTYEVELTGLSADLDLIVMGGGYGSCDPSATCIASSVTAGTAEERLTFTTNGGEYYWIAVDGKEGAVSPYMLKVRSDACYTSCYQAANRISCSYLDDFRRNDDPERSKNAIDGWGCDSATDGPEVVYQLRPPSAGSYTLTLDGLEDDLDLLVMTGTSGSCDPMGTCLAHSTESGTTPERLTFTADPSQFYYIAVEGKQGAVSPYHLQLSSASCPAPVCASSGHNLSCALASRSLTFQNDQAGATSDVSSWACAAGETGPESAHLFTPSGPGPYTVEMIGLGADLDLIVLPAGPGGTTCDPTAACTASSVTAGTGSEKVTFTADPNQKYWLIVDGKDGAISPYTLAITSGCP